MTGRGEKALTIHEEEASKGGELKAVVPRDAVLDDQPSRSDEVRRSSRRITATGLSIIAVLIIGFGGWAGFAPLASGVLGEGVIVAEGDRGTVRHLEGGVVAEILVNEGDTVAAGQVLVRLDDVQTRAQLDSLQAEYDGHAARHARLTAERAGDENISFPKTLMDRITAGHVREIVLGERALFEERRNALNVSLSMIAQSRALYGRHIAGAKAQIASMNTQLSIIKDELAGLEKLLAQGHIEKPRVLRLKREAAQLEGEIGSETSSVAQGEIKIIESRIEEARIKTDFRKSVVAELREVQDRLFDLEERVSATRDVLERLDIRAPGNGAVLDLQVHARDAVLLPGDPVLDIVPAGKILTVETKIRPTDIDNVAVGAEAEIRFTAFRQRTTPSVLGTVTTVAADTLNDAETNAPYYTARVKVSETERGRLDGKPLVPGMPADVTIRSGERTLIEYLLEPLTDMMARSFKE